MGTAAFPSGPRLALGNCARPVLRRLEHTCAAGLQRHRFRLGASVWDVMASRREHGHVWRLAGVASPSSHAPAPCLHRRGLGTQHRRLPFCPVAASHAQGSRLQRRPVRPMAGLHGIDADGHRMHPGCGPWISAYFASGMVDLAAAEYTASDHQGEGAGLPRVMGAGNTIQTQQLRAIRPMHFRPRGVRGPSETRPSSPDGSTARSTSNRASVSMWWRRPDGPSICHIWPGASYVRSRDCWVHVGDASRRPENIVLPQQRSVTPAPPGCLGRERRQGFRSPLSQ